MGRGHQTLWPPLFGYGGGGAWPLSPPPMYAYELVTFDGKKQAKTDSQSVANSWSVGWAQQLS